MVSRNPNRIAVFPTGSGEEVAARQRRTLMPFVAGQAKSPALQREIELSFCPHCFAMIDPDAPSCPVCGTDLEEWHAQGYAERLITALRHPLADIRMRAIIALGWSRESLAEQALVECALRHPKDVVEGVEIVNSLSLISDVTSRRDGLLRLACFHPVRSVAEAARLALEGAWKRTYRGIG